MHAASVVCVALLLVATAVAWGPATHYYFTCAGVYGVDATSSCLTNHPHLLAGTEMPDAFYFAHYSDPNDVCVRFEELHNPDFATFMALQAFQLGKPHLVDFAIGYGAHIVGDVAGFFPGGFLGNGMLANKSVVDWISMWPYMTAVDAYVARSILNVTSLASLNISLSMTMEHAEFVSNASKALALQVPATPTPSAAEVLACASQWRNIVQVETAKALALPSASYQFELLYNNPFHAQNATAAENDFTMAANCAIGGVTLWLSQVSQPNANITEVINAVGGYYYTSFMEGECAPLTSPGVTALKQALGKPKVEFGKRKVKLHF